MLRAGTWWPKSSGWRIDTVSDVRVNILGVIPARGGSKGIPRKNIRPVAGRPLIAYTIEAARKARSLSRVIVSTDDPEIAEVARAWGAEAPFLRPAELARDDTPGPEPIIHAVEWLRDHEGYRPELVMKLQPTSPLREARDIDAAVEIARRRDADSVVSVCALKHHPYWTKAIAPDGRLTTSIPTDRSYASRQELPPMYALAGAIYLVKTAVLLATRNYYTDRTYAYVIPEERALDVDTPWDLRVLEALLRAESPR